MYALKSFFSIRCKNFFFPSSPHGSTLSPSFGVCFPLACGRHMNGNWRAWEPDVKTFAGSDLRFFRARTLLVRDEDCLIERPPQILTGLRCDPFQSAPPGITLERCRWGRGSSQSRGLCLTDSTFHPTLGLENNFRVGGVGKNQEKPRHHPSWSRIFHDNSSKPVSPQLGSLGDSALSR